MSPVGQRIHTLRVNLGLKRSQLAKRANVSSGTIHYIETGVVAQPDFSTVAKIAGVLLTTAEYLFTGLGRPYNATSKLNDAARRSGIDRASFSPADLRRELPLREVREMDTKADSRAAGKGGSGA